MAAVRAQPGYDEQVTPPTALEMRAVTRFWRFVVILAGAVAGFAIVWTHPDRGRDVWYGWAALGTLLGVLAGSAFGSGIARYRDVTALQPVRWVRVVPPVLLMAVVALGALPLSLVIVDQGIIWQGLALAGLAIVGAVTAGAAVVAIRILAIDGIAGEVGRRLGALLRLRLLLSRLTTVFGSLVVVLTLFTAAQRTLETGEKVPASLVIYTGAASAVVVALVYLPTAAVLRRRCIRFVDEEFPLDGVARAQLIQAADDRHRLEGILGLHRTTLAELQNGLVIVAPLLASAGIALLPGF
jgi:hypothetical protein